MDIEKLDKMEIELGCEKGYISFEHQKRTDTVLEMYF